MDVYWAELDSSRNSNQQNLDDCQQPFQRVVLPSSANAPGQSGQISRSDPSIVIFLKRGLTCDGSGTRWVVIVTGTSVTNKISAEARVIQPRARVVPATTNATPESQSRTEGSPIISTVCAHGDSFIRSSII